MITLKQKPSMPMTVSWQPSWVMFLTGLLYVRPLLRSMGCVHQALKAISSWERGELGLVAWPGMMACKP